VVGDLPGDRPEVPGSQWGRVDPRRANLPAMTAYSAPAHLSAWSSSWDPLRPGTTDPIPCRQPSRQPPR